MRISTFIVSSFVFLTLLAGSFLINAIADPGNGNGPPENGPTHPFQQIIVSDDSGCTQDPAVPANQNPATCCIDALVQVCCPDGYTLVGGGASLDLGVPFPNNNAGDNVALQNSEPAETPNCWYAYARELQNTPGQGGWNIDGNTAGSQVGTGCNTNPRPARCFPNWASKTGSCGVNATSSPWTLYGYAICVALPPNNDANNGNGPPAP